MTIYLFVMQHQGIFKMSKIHQFATEYLLDWFPDLGSYQAFKNRLNRISCVMGPFVETLLNEFAPKECSKSYSVPGSMHCYLLGETCGKSGPRDYGQRLLLYKKHVLSRHEAARFGFLQYGQVAAPGTDHVYTGQCQ